MPRKGLILFFSILIAFALSIDASAQCVMCKAVGEQSSKLDGLGRGLNAGILFLMSIPYVLMVLGGIIIWRRFNKQEEN